MKRHLPLLALAFMIVFLFCGCGAEGGNGLEILKDAKAIEVTHYLAGSYGKVTLSDKKDIELLDKYVGSMVLEKEEFSPGNTPGDKDGGEIYTFLPDNKNGPASLIINGPEEHYLLHGEDWYRIKNPESPPMIID